MTSRTQGHRTPERECFVINDEEVRGCDTKTALSQGTGNSAVNFTRKGEAAKV